MPVFQWRQRGLMLDNVLPFLLTPQCRNRPGEAEGGGKVVLIVVLEGEEDGVVLWLRLRQRHLPRWKALLETSLGNFASGCTILCAATFVFLPARPGNGA